MSAFTLAASGASDQDVWRVYGCSFSLRFQWHHRRPWLTSAAADIVDLSPSAFSLAAPHLHGVLVLVTGNKFIAGVVVTGDKVIAVSLSPAINLSPISTTPAITENPWQRWITGVNDTDDKFFAGVIDTAEHLITSVVEQCGYNVELLVVVYFLFIEEYSFQIKYTMIILFVRYSYLVLVQCPKITLNWAERSE